LVDTILAAAAAGFKMGLPDAYQAAAHAAKQPHPGAAAASVAAGNRHCLNSATVVKTGSPDAYEALALRVIAERLENAEAKPTAIHIALPAAA
jgi:hypothetical protein